MKLWGIAARFETGDEALRAARELRSAGYRHLEAYAPFPFDELSEAIGMKHDNVALWALLGGIIGGLGAYFMMWYANVIDYPINVGGRPYHSWPAFIPITFELTVLGSALFCAVAMLAANGLPKLFHPMFLVPEFAERGSTDAFYLAIRSEDPKFEREKLRDLFRELKAVNVVDVPKEYYELPEEEP